MSPTSSPMPPAPSATSYSLGSTDPEIARLDTQAEFLAVPTRALLQASGLQPGMRVLDLGTGLGHVARAVAEIVGTEGEVVGLDSSPRMLEVAASRVDSPPQVRYVEGDVTAWRDDEPFDAVVGRLILFHLSDPVGALRHHLEGVRPGGRVVALDYDIGAVRAEPPDRLSASLRDLILAAFRAAGADPTIGSRLKQHLQAAGVEDIGGFGVAQYVAPEDPVGPVMVSGVIRSLMPVILGHGLATAEEVDIDNLQARVAESLAEHGSALVPPMLAGAWGRRA
jgi:SAM-dependent methyltransferase